MRRVVPTKTGAVVVGIQEGRRYGLEVDVTTYGPDGWQVGVEPWSSRTRRGRRDATLTAFLARVVQLTDDEADRLATEIRGPQLDAWRRRGDERDYRIAESWTRATLVILAALATLALVGLATIVRFAAGVFA